MKDQFVDAAGTHLLRAAAKFIGFLPLEAARFFGRAAGTVYFPFSSRRRNAYADLKAAFGDRYTAAEIWRIVRDHYRHVGQCAAEVFSFSAMSPEEFGSHFEVADLKPVYDAESAGRGLIFLTGHIGNWELLVQYARFQNRPMRVVARTQKFPRLNNLINQIRQGQGSEVAHTGFGLRGVLRALRNRERVGILGDQSAGRGEGIILPFFGRKTTVPTGAFEIARRTNALILPAFIVRNPNGKYRIFFGRLMDPSAESDGEDKDEKLIREYVADLEKIIREYPEQWLWAKKRWKYSWTRKLLILSDGKPGHYKQSQAIADQFKQIQNYHDRPGMECSVEKIMVKYRSKFHRALFFFSAFFLLPWVQGRMKWLRFFLAADCANEIARASADFVISAGSSLVPVNCCVARENAAKSIVIMKPPFPYNFFHYDLALIPAHDRGILPKKNLRSWVTPSSVNGSGVAPGTLRSELPRPERVKTAVFIGGPTRHYTVDMEKIEELMETLETSAPEMGDYIVTTSRRTPEPVISRLKARRETAKHFQKLVIASEDTRAGISEQMMETAELLLMSEDSISMISEGVAKQKKVIVFGLGNRADLPEKHRQFIRALTEREAVLDAEKSSLMETVRLSAKLAAPIFFREENSRLSRRVKEML